MTWLELPEVRLSIGGAYIRVWRSGLGLSVELPALLIREKASGEVIAYGDEAQGMEGKLPESLEAIHPFWGDSIRDREALRFLLSMALKLDRQQTKIGWQSWLQTYTLVLPATLSPLHQRWLLTTCREAWPLPWKSVLDTSLLKNSNASEVWGLLDLGFSAARATLVSSGRIVATKSEPRLGFAQFCAQVIREEEERHSLRFPSTVFYQQEWFVQQSALSSQNGKPVFSPLHKDVFQMVLQEYRAAVAALLEEVGQIAPEEARSHLSRQGWTLVGGAATLPEMEKISETLSLPVQIHAHPRYATLRGGKT